MRKLGADKLPPAIGVNYDADKSAAWMDRVVIPVVFLLCNKLGLSADTTAKIHAELVANPPLIPILKATPV